MMVIIKNNVPTLKFTWPWLLLINCLPICYVNSQVDYESSFANVQYPFYYYLPQDYKIDVAGVTKPIVSPSSSAALAAFTRTSTSALPSIKVTLNNDKKSYEEIDIRNSQPETHFQNCHMSDSDFDVCIKDALNEVRPLFKIGVPKMGIEPFDPFYAKEIVQTRSIEPMFGYRLRLLNVTESGWTQSQVTRFKSDLRNNYIKYTQFFPDKYLKGSYELNGHVFSRKLDMKGTWELNLYDFIQTTTISRRPRMVDGQKQYDTPLRVNVNVQTCQEMELHVSNLLGGRRIMESVLDRLINFAWPPGFVVLKPLINDLVSTAFTDIFNRNFQDFDFHQILPY